MTENKPFTVSEVNRILKNQITAIAELQRFKVRGEISNLNSAGNGHTYFKLRDKLSLINCAFFINHKKLYKGKKLENGMEVDIVGSINFYEPTSYPSINVYSIEEIGKGDILYKIELLKQKLNSQGIFSEERKRPIPRFPSTIGIATSMNGAAVQDIIKVIRSVSSRVNILLCPCIVQGELAPKSIISAIRELNNPNWNVDVIIAGRGGGSSEDLMAFNDEEVVMAFYHSRVPIISAVGHEIDTVLTDYSADDSAPTPSVGAETVVSSLFNINLILNDLQSRLSNSLSIKIKTEKDKYKKLIGNRVFQMPENILYDRYQKIDEIIKNIFLVGQNNLSKKSSKLSKYENLSFLMRTAIDKKKNNYQLVEEKLEHFSPLLTLKRGYSVVRNKEKKVIKSIKQLKLKDELEIIIDEGRIIAEVKELK